MIYFNKILLIFIYIYFFLYYFLYFNKIFKIDFTHIKNKQLNLILHMLSLKKNMA